MAGYKRLAAILSMCVLGVFSMNWVEAKQNEDRVVSAVLDRMEDNDKAVLLMEDEEKEWVVKRNVLPSGARTGEWFDVYFQGPNEYRILQNEKHTEKMEKKIEGLRKNLPPSEIRE